MPASRAGICNGKKHRREGMLVRGDTKCDVYMDFCGGTQHVPALYYIEQRALYFFVRTM